MQSSHLKMTTTMKYMNLTQSIPFNEKLFDTCLTKINIYDQNQREILFEEVAGHSHRVKITSVNRVKNQTLTIDYNFHGNISTTLTTLCALFTTE